MFYLFGYFQLQVSIIRTVNILTSISIHKSLTPKLIQLYSFLHCESKFQARTHVMVLREKREEGDDIIILQSQKLKSEIIV